MKKIFAFILCLSMLLLCACSNTQNENETTTESTTQAEETTERVKSESLFDGYKYRAIYYDVPAPFVELVDKDAFWDWYNNSPYRQYPLDVDEMAMVAFIKKFNISREDFDKANEKDKEILLKYSDEVVVNPAEEDPYYDRALESKEIYNADIIYTFDNELINAYYLYVDPYENESSTVGDGVLDVPNYETTSEPVSETAPAEFETNITEIPTETATAEESTTTGL